MDGSGVPNQPQTLGDLLPPITMGGYEPRITVDPGAAAFHGAMRVEVQLLEDGVVPVWDPQKSSGRRVGRRDTPLGGTFFGR